jgi:succinate dehydrogenase / fumarate reductase, cytochrome b subunit
MAAALAFTRTTIGKKMLMAVTGAIGYGFVIGHMAGNLHIFEGPEEFNAYAEGLRSFGAPFVPHSGLLWVVRLVLLAAVLTHVWLAIDLTRQDRASRPIPYGKKDTVQASFASKTLRYGGTAIFFFLLYHLSHLTWGFAHPNFSQTDAYHNVIAGFSNPLVVLFYLIAMAALALHLYHGVWSMFQSLGLNSYRTNSMLRGLALFSGIALFVGFSIVPIAVVTGLVG